MKIMLMATVLMSALGFTAGASAAGDVDAGKKKSAVCAGCHGADGNSPSDMFPKIAGQNASYIVKQLADMKTGKRDNPVMAPIVANLSQQDMEDLAAYFASQKATPGAVSEELKAAGEKIYRGGNKETGVPACMACHGPTGAGMAAAKWPALAYQYPAYVEKQLHAFASGDRHNDPNHMMRDISSRMSDKEIKAVAAYVSGLH